MRDMKVATLQMFAEDYDLSINWLKLDRGDFSPVSFYVLIIAMNIEIIEI